MLDTPFPHSDQRRRKAASRQLHRNYGRAEMNGHGLTSMTRSPSPSTNWAGISSASKYHPTPIPHTERQLGRVELLAAIPDRAIGRPADDQIGVDAASLVANLQDAWVLIAIVRQPLQILISERIHHRRRWERSGQVTAVSVERREPIERTGPTIADHRQKPAIVIWQTDPVGGLNAVNSLSDRVGRASSDAASSQIRGSWRRSPAAVGACRPIQRCRLFLPHEHIPMSTMIGKLRGNSRRACHAPDHRAGRVQRTVSGPNGTIPVGLMVRWLS